LAHPAHREPDVVSARVAIALAVLVVAAGCGSARRSEPLTGAFAPPSAEAARGERVFMANCHQCHPGGEAGLGPAINNKPLPTGLIRFQVREGIGAMPAFAKDDIPDGDLDALLAYLKARR
jgi:mono/diheme cytochrome c family protein